jgi:hypothetical protein
MELDPAQRQLIADLIAEMRDDAAARERRWGQAFPLARDSALRGRLRLHCGSWFHALELDTDGALHVLLGDPPAAGAERTVANALEANFAWFGTMERFPELRFLLPVRPADASECRICGGTGEPPWQGQHLVVCGCGGAGWLPPGAEGMTAYADGFDAPDAASSAPARGPSSRLDAWWRRVRGRA